jgi:opacity protein-like surface antigen
MKKILVIFCVILGLGTISINTMQAQDVKGQMIATIGIGMNRIGDVGGFDASDGLSKKTPVFHGEFDRALSNRFSGGIALTYQKVSSERSGQKAGNRVVEDLKTTIAMTDVSLRGLFHLSNDARFDFYAGLRLGYMMFNYNYNYDEYEPTEDGETESKVTIAPTIGLRCFLNETIAASIEVDITKYPYILGLGVNFRIE